MGSPGASNNSGGKDTNTPFGKASSTKTKTKFGYTKPKSKVKSYIKTGGAVGAITKPIRKKTEEVNRKFYEEKVLPSGKSKYKNYEDYIRARGRGEVDAYGREISKSDNNNNQVVQSPTTSEVSQVTQTEVTTPEVEVDKPEEKEDDITIRKRRIKAKGRSPTILTGVTGVTGDLTLGKPSLLGR